MCANGMFTYFWFYMLGHNQACHATMLSQGTYCGYCTGGTDFHFYTDNEGWGRAGWGRLYKKKKVVVVEGGGVG